MLPSTEPPTKSLSPVHNYSIVVGPAGLEPATSPSESNTLIPRRTESSGTSAHGLRWTRSTLRFMTRPARQFPTASPTFPDAARLELAWVCLQGRCLPLGYAPVTSILSILCRLPCPAECAPAAATIRHVAVFLAPLQRVQFPVAIGAHHVTFLQLSFATVVAPRPDLVRHFLTSVAVVSLQIQPRTTSTTRSIRNQPSLSLRLAFLHLSRPRVSIVRHVSIMTITSGVACWIRTSVRRFAGVCVASPPTQRTGADSETRTRVSRVALWCLTLRPCPQLVPRTGLEPVYSRS
jgi:hypothetical protein